MSIEKKLNTFFYLFLHVNREKIEESNANQMDQPITANRAWSGPPDAFKNKYDWLTIP